MTNKSRPAEPGSGQDQGWGGMCAAAEHRRAWLGVGAVVLVAAFLYAPALHHEFTNWDDDQQIAANPDIRDLSLRGVGKMFSSFYVTLYQPLTSLTFAVEYRLFGLDPRAYHTVNVLLHLANILLVYVLARSLARNTWIALATAGLFAVHPLQVEVAAWASSLSILLSTLLYLATLVAYVAYVRSGRARCFVGALALFVLALLAKTAAATLPLVLLVIDLYLRRDFLRPGDARENREEDEDVRGAASPQRRCCAAEPGACGRVCTWVRHLPRRLNWRLIGEKVPFFLLAFVFGCITMFARSGVGHMQDFALKFSLVQRICIVCYCCLWYVGKLVFPAGLSAFNPFPRKPNDWLPVVYYLAPVLLLGLAVGIRYAGRYRRLLAFAALFMLASLLLVVQIIPISYLMVCDRYAYIPCIGLFFLAGTLGYQLGARSPSWRKGMVLAWVAVLAVFSGATYRRVGVWRDSLTLWNDVISKRQDISAAYLNRGLAEAKKGDDQAARADFDVALGLNPGSDKALNNRAVARMRLGDPAGALRDFDEAVRLNPADTSYVINRGILKRNLGDLSGALRDFDTVLGLDERNLRALCERADTHWRQGNWPRVIADYEAVLRLNPRDAAATLSLGAALLEAGDGARAVAMLNRGLSLGTQEAGPAYALLARAYYKMGQTDLANEAWRRAQEAGFSGPPAEARPGEQTGRP